MKGAGSVGRSWRQVPGPVPCRPLAPSRPSACPSSLPPPPRPCAHIHQHIPISRCIPVAHIPKHAQHATAGRQAASCSPHLLPSMHAPPHLPPPMYGFRRQAGTRPTAPSARSSPPPFFHPHAPSLAHVCPTWKVQRGEGGALGHALRCQHSKALGAHATVCLPTTLLSEHATKGGHTAPLLLLVLAPSIFHPVLSIHTHGVHECE